MKLCGWASRYFAFSDGDADAPRISYAAHLSGALSGLLLGLVVLRNLRVRRWERLLWWGALLAFLALFLAGIVWNAVLVGLDSEYLTS